MNWTISFHIFQVKVWLNVFLKIFFNVFLFWKGLRASKNSRLPVHAPVLRSLDIRPFQTTQLSYLLMINLVTSYDIKTARNNIILFGQMILLFWNLKIESLFKYMQVGLERSYIAACPHFCYVFARWLIKVGAMLEGMWIFREDRNGKLFHAISMWHICNEDFSARKRRKLGNNQTVTICGIYRS